MGKNNKKIYYIIFTLILIILIILSIIYNVKKAKCKEINSQIQENEKIKKGQEFQSSKQVENKRKTTVIDYNKQYEKYISNIQDAIKEIEQEADIQRNKYSNNEINEIEARMEEKYNICAVNLGEIDKETAQSIEKAFEFMYSKFPKLKGQLTNLSLGNLENSDNNIAITEEFEFMKNPGLEDYPKVLKHQIILSARDFLNKERMKNIINKGIQTNHWTKDTNIESIVVHELGHCLIDVIIAKRYNLDNIVYINENNYSNYIAYINDGLAVNQTTAKAIVEEAYKRYGNNSYEEFCKSISEYALGLKQDGGYSYTETCAEACSDYYLHGEMCAKASKLIVEVIIEHYNNYV